MPNLNLRLYPSTANFTKVQKIAIQWIALSDLCTTDPRLRLRLNLNLNLNFNSNLNLTGT